MVAHTQGAVEEFVDEDRAADEAFPVVAGWQLKKQLLENDDAVGPNDALMVGGKDELEVHPGRLDEGAPAFRRGNREAAVEVRDESLLQVLVSLRVAKLVMPWRRSS